VVVIGAGGKRVFVGWDETYSVNCLGCQREHIIKQFPTEEKKGSTSNVICRLKIISGL